MNRLIIWILFALLMASCKSDTQEINPYDIEIPFDKNKWKFEKDSHYPYRNAMLTDMLSNDSLRALNQEGILNTLGKPTKIDSNYLFYRISEKKMGAWTLTAKTLVFKFKNDGSIEWIKTHG